MVRNDRRTSAARPSHHQIQSEPEKSTGAPILLGCPRTGEVKNEPQAFLIDMSPERDDRAAFPRRSTSFKYSSPVAVWPGRNNEIAGSR